MMQYKFSAVFVSFLSLTRAGTVSMVSQQTSVSVTTILLQDYNKLVQIMDNMADLVKAGSIGSELVNQAKTASTLAEDVSADFDLLFQTFPGLGSSTFQGAVDGSLAILVSELGVVASNGGNSQDEAADFQGAANQLHQTVSKNVNDLVDAVNEIEATTLNAPAQP
ncbi:hypothetical protein F5Y16DRAFT_405089 [Xylariaceae sp. FL0255]|nr:hypothetical protein F5Y16DRAFT_405089 [Xylariaceae sp. FL0255]